MNFVRVLFSNNGENRSAPRRNVRQELKLHEARVINTPLALREQRCFAHWVRISANSTTGKTTPQNRNCNHREMHIAVMGASEGTRFPLMQPFSTRCLLRFHGHAIRGQCLFFPGFKGHGNAIGPIMCRLCPIYHRTSDSFQPRFGATTKKREFPPPRSSSTVRACVFYLSDRWPRDAKSMDDIFQRLRDKTSRHECRWRWSRRGWKTNVVNQVWGWWGREVFGAVGGPTFQDRDLVQLFPFVEDGGNILGRNLIGFTMGKLARYGTPREYLRDRSTRIRY